MTNLHAVQRMAVQLAVIAGFTGTLWLTISLGPIHLFPFRIIVLLLWVLLFINSGKINVGHIKVGLYLKFLWFWVIYAALSVIWAADRISAVKHLIFLLLCISMVFFIVQIIRDILDVKRLLIIWAGLFVLLLPIGFWEVITGEHLSNSGLLNVDEGYELYKFAPTTFFGNQNDYATLIALTLPMFYISLGYVKKWYFKGLLLAIITASIIMLLFTTSRANYIGVGIGVSFWFLFLMRLQGKVRFLVLSAILLIIISFNLTIEKIEFLTSIWDDFSTLTDSDDGGVDVRGNLVKNGIYFGFMSGGFGVGAGNIEYYMQHNPYFPVGEITNVHNWWVEIFANYGIIVFVGYLLFYVNIILSLLKLRKKLLTDTERVICDSLLCGMVSFSISCLSSSSILAFNPHWIFFGLALAFINIKRNMLILR